ncbi:hypothetical protein A5804_002776 [Enterococcus faecium]|uniref:Uncharacterized protein n=1 Tax=Enterococcus faecium TaxID=1352 RepID=A0AB73P126_ENTFC|nr:hypothetical protein [Enterococcus faecium]OTN94465.1 hypothetical protein A5804_002776 [Enterococcus faecium]
MKCNQLSIEKDNITEIVNEIVPLSDLPKQQIYIEYQRLLLNAIIQYIFYVYPSDKHTISHCLHLLNNENINQTFLTLSQYHPARISYEKFLEQISFAKEGKNINSIENNKLFQQTKIGLEIILRGLDLETVLF